MRGFPCRRYHPMTLSALARRLLPALMACLPAVLCQPARGQPVEAGAIVAARLLPGEHLKLDGRLDHPAWQRAPVYERFVQKVPEVGAAASRATRVQVLHDEQALYVGVQALDEAPAQLRAPLVRHDQVNRTQDFVAVYIDAIGTRQSAQFFRVNAAGSTADGMHTASDDSEDFAPDFDFDAAARRHARGYDVVLRIPFASLRFESGATPAWRIMVVRRVPREQFYLDSSVLIPREAPSFVATLQPLEGVQLPERHQFLTLRPSLTLHRQRQQPAGGPALRDSGLDASLDLKWRPRPEWVVDATLNPDFSQVALDVPQLAGNTRFALQFDEKRPFFFESSDLLRSPTEAVYTRSFTEPRWGLRSTWRGRGMAGSALLVDDRGGGAVLLPGAYGTGIAEQPASTALVARARSDEGALQWGGLAVARRYAGGRGDNAVIGPDLAWQLDDAWRVRAQWLQARTTAQPDDAGVLQAGTAREGGRIYLKATRLTDRSEASLSIDDIDPGFRHDSGFVAQAGVRRTALFLGRHWTFSGPVSEFWLNLHADHVRDTVHGQDVTRDVYPGFWLGGAHNLEWWMEWHGAAHNRPDAPAPLLRERYWKGELIVTPARWLPFVILGGRAGRITDVETAQLRRGGELNLTLTTRPHARLEFEPRWSQAWLAHDGQRVLRDRATQVLAVWHLDARQTLRAIVQRTTLDRLAEPGAAARREAGTLGSLTYAWRRSAGTVLYVGASRSRLGAHAPERGNELFIKLQLDADEVRGLY